MAQICILLAKNEKKREKNRGSKEEILYIGEFVMFCGNCGKELPENALFCGNCGKSLAPALPQKIETPPSVNDYQNRGAVPVYQQPVPFQQQININIPQQPVEYKSKWITARVVIGIITVGLFTLFQLQSCLACAGEAVQNVFSDEEDTSGTTGYVVSYFFLIAGIVSIVCRKSKGGSIAAGIIYGLCGMALISENFSYFQDLAFYCFISFAFCITMIIGGILQKTKT